MLDLTKLTTEQRNPKTMELDSFSPIEIARVMNEENTNVIKAIDEVLPQVASAIEWAGEALNAGGRIIYMGAGTSGRLGVLDAVECPPTFGVSYDTVVGLIAGGEGAFVKAAEGAEDNAEAGAADLAALELESRDIVIGIAASGRTPYVIGGLRYANEAGCRTVAIACNKNSAVGAEAQLAIEPVTGPEVLTGSTRLKAGTAQKLVLNMISTGSMVAAGKVYQNLMVDVKQSNEKLRVRAQNIVMMATECTREQAAEALEACHHHVKGAIAMLLLDCDATAAETALDEAHGHVRAAVEAHKA
uniref:N-acetylmuramic acid 6-phosphate etherase n=1 Tax=Parolsenella massiliensis TaxID=1871022 RepID=UPI000932CE4C|nr:N-acetylmuramic acid 6-phosphate etherase [Parolsenella massiliensis]